jgi:hypothetical protein
MQAYLFVFVGAGLRGARRHFLNPTGLSPARSPT